METKAPVPWLRTRLSVQLFLEFAIWGSWAPVLGNHMKSLQFERHESGLVYATGALATMISPLIAGQIADRYFPTQYFLAICYAGGGVLFYFAAQAVTFASLWWYMLAAMLFFAPTLGLDASICFHHLPNARRDFPLVRLWGTVGWIAAGIGLNAWLTWQPTRPVGDCLYMAALFCAVETVYALTLPHTPPKRDAAGKFAVGKVLKMLRDPSFVVFIGFAFCLLIFTSFYYAYAGRFFEEIGVAQKDVSLVLLIGQVMEIVILFLLPWVYRKLGAKRTIAIGVGAWALRFAIFALAGPKELMIAAQALHGICFAFGLSAALIYSERISAPDVRGSMQSFLMFVSYGAGLLFGSILSGYVNAWSDGNWSSFWLVPSLGCCAALIIFLIGFQPRDAQPEPVSTASPPPKDK